MLVIITTQATIRPSKPLTTLEIYNLTKTVAGKTLQIQIDASKTLQDLADAADSQMSIDPTLTIEERLIKGDNVLDNNQTLAQAGITDGSSVVYKFVLLA